MELLIVLAVMLLGGIAYVLWGKKFWCWLLKGKFGKGKQGNVVPDPISFSADDLAQMNKVELPDPATAETEKDFILGLLLAVGAIDTKIEYLFQLHIQEQAYLKLLGTKYAETIGYVQGIQDYIKDVNVTFAMEQVKLLFKTYGWRMLAVLFVLAVGANVLWECVIKPGVGLLFSIR